MKTTIEMTRECTGQGTLRTKHSVSIIAGKPAHRLRAVFRDIAAGVYKCDFDHYQLVGICRAQPGLLGAIDTLLQNEPAVSFDYNFAYVNFSGGGQDLELIMERVREARPAVYTVRGTELAPARIADESAELKIQRALTEKVMTVYVERTLFDRGDINLDYVFFANCIKHINFKFAPFTETICDGVCNVNNRGGFVLLKVAATNRELFDILELNADLIYAELLGHVPPQANGVLWIRRLVELHKLGLRATTELCDTTLPDEPLVPTIGVFDDIVERIHLKKYISKHLAAEVDGLRRMLSRGLDAVETVAYT